MNILATMYPNEWRKADHAAQYLQRADALPHRSEGESALLDEMPARADAVLDLGTGDGRLLSLVLGRCRAHRAVGIDFSPVMIDRFRERFAARADVGIVEHDLGNPLPDLGQFNVVVSSFAIHHVSHSRKRDLYAEVFASLRPGGVFCNLEHVSSSTEKLHRRFLEFLDIRPEDEDPSNQLLDVHTQLAWLREVGFADVDCLWKWRELALLAGWRQE